MSVFPLTGVLLGSRPEAWGDDDGWRKPAGATAARASLASD
ncbi:hypothetical protein ABIA33_000596 [Streptacidiphilus sp. MAP12-16]